MSRVLVVVNNTQVVNDGVSVTYSTSVIGPPNFSYESDYKVDTEISVGSNLTIWKNKIIAEVLEQGVIIIGSDIIVFGAPS